MCFAYFRGAASARINGHPTRLVAVAHPAGAATVPVAFAVDVGQAAVVLDGRHVGLVVLRHHHVGDVVIERRAEMRMRQTVDNRIKDDSRLGEIRRNGRGDRRQWRVFRAKLANECHNGVRSPGRDVDEDESDDDLGRADLGLTPKFAEGAAVLVDADHLSGVRKHRCQDASVTSANE